ncbi:MAG: tRNA (5-methylaminomethyl-2-thiouridine)(34)-methyltransferase MnmD [Bacteroidales bacterium]
MAERVIETIVTADGSHTLYIPEMDEHYHSVHGAIQESTHVFINNGLRALQADSVSILEIGFGTGLNALLSMVESMRTGRVISYTSLELYPLSLEMMEKLNYSELLSLSSQESAAWKRVCQAEWSTLEGDFTQVAPTFSIRKIETDFTKFEFMGSYNMVYFDAFAPDKQPEMWSQELFDSIGGATLDGGVLTTYCAKGVVRRQLMAAGYVMERLPGPPGKRQMLRGIMRR